MQSHLKISRVEPSDILVIGDMLLHTKMSLTVNRLLWKHWPNEAAQRAQYTSSVEGGHGDATMLDYKVVDSTNDKIVGYMIMADKQAADPAEASTQMYAEQQQLPPELDEHVLKEVFQAVAAVEKHWQHEKRLDLVFIVVEPSYRRQGVGKALMKLCLDRARELQVPFVVSSEPAALQFFESFDLTSVGHGDMDLARFAPAQSGFGIFRLTGLVWRPD